MLVLLLVTNLEHCLLQPSASRFKVYDKVRFLPQFLCMHDVQILAFNVILEKELTVYVVFCREDLECE
jgi:hypothetical protein